MPKSFYCAGGAGPFASAGAKSRAKAPVVAVANTDNGEGVEYTADLELSMEQAGFTDFGMEDVRYMIVSGHRLRRAGVRRGMDVFSCIARHFASRGEMVNCMLPSQSFRDSSKGPLLYARRYRMHEKCLEEAGFSGSKAEEVTRRGNSVWRGGRVRLKVRALRGTVRGLESRPRR